MTMESKIIQSATDAIIPVMESGIILAGQYTKMSGRNTMTAMDMKYAIRFCARNVLGKELGTLFPEIYEENSDSDDDIEIETVDDDEDPFIRYQGDDELMNRVNECYDTWDEWEPQSPLEMIVKSSADNIA